MKRSDIKILSQYFEKYIELVDDVELDDAFNKSIQQLNEIQIPQLQKIGLQTYAEKKWTIHQVVQHITDWERIWCYRTLLFVRCEGTIPSGHDENKMAANSNANEIPITQLIEELKSVRMATQALFQTFNKQQFEITCKFINYEMSVLAMGFNIIGHQLHHFNVIQERYVPLVS